MMTDKDSFKEDFKYFKRKSPTPNFNKVIDFELSHNFDAIINASEKFPSCKSYESNCSVCQKLNMKPHQTWELFALKGLEGFFYIKNPFEIKGQQEWIQKCLEKYPCKPSLTNLDVHFDNVDDIWSLRNDPDPEKRSYISKLCWATLGYHHDWNTKLYNPKHRSPMPPCLQELSNHIAACLGFVTFKPEAAIVNYYNLKSSLGIHNDHSEEDLESPIISISFGQTGLFLIGTDNKLDKPEAIFLRSGDIVIMSGSCRLSYHAVPCILTEDVGSRCFNNKIKDWEEFYEYISISRINISVRKVYKTL